MCKEGLPHLDILMKPRIKPDVPVGVFNALCQLDDSLEKGATRSNDFTGKLKGSYQRLKFYKGS